MADGSATAATAAILDRVLELDWRRGPGDLPLLIKLCLLDWLGVSIAGAANPAVAILRRELESQGGNPQAFVFGSETCLSGEQAALLNGTISHILDYDDVNFAIPGHASAPVLASVLAQAELCSADGASIMNAFLSGYEGACRIARLLAPDHYSRGFHATATMGCFGAALGCSRLLGLDRRASARALGIAATRAAGLKAVFGTACKGFHAGIAASTGRLAAVLARDGFESREDVLECAQGFAVTHSSSFDPEGALGDPPGGFHLYGNLFKFHAAVYEAQAVIECAGRLRRDPAFSLEAVDTVRLRANPHCKDICNIANPETGAQAKFSLRSAAAFALAGLDTARPDTFSDDNARSPRLRRLCDRVAVEFSAGIPLTACEMEVRLQGNSTIGARHDAGVPMRDRDEQVRRVTGKFDALVAPLLGADRAALIAATVNGLEDLSGVGSLMRLCA